MRRKISVILFVLAMAAVAFIVRSCGIYSFSGTSIQADVYTVNIHYFEYKALRVNPTLSNDLTEALKDQFRRLTRLEQVDENGDLDIVGEITGYDVKAMGITANEVAAQNRLTVNVKIYFTNNKYPEDNLEQSFSAYADFDATQSRDAVESTICEDIIDQLVEDIFNATVAQW